MLNYSECRKLLDSCIDNRFRLTNFGGCYNCLTRFDYSKITEWTKNTAHCPNCNCQTVLDDPDEKTLDSMCYQWNFDNYSKLKEKQNYERKMKLREHFRKLNDRHKEKAKLLRFYKNNLQKSKNPESSYWISSWIKI